MIHSKPPKASDSDCTALASFSRLDQPDFIDRPRVQPLVLALAGYTKSRKSTLARILSLHTPFRHLEMSQMLRERIVRRSHQLTVHSLVAETRTVRSEYGPDVLARHLHNFILNDGGDYY